MIICSNCVKLIQFVFWREEKKHTVVYTSLCPLSLYFLPKEKNGLSSLLGVKEFVANKLRESKKVFSQWCDYFKQSEPWVVLGALSSWAWLHLDVGWTIIGLFQISEESCEKRVFKNWYFVSKCSFYWIDSFLDNKGGNVNCLLSEYTVRTSTPQHCQGIRHLFHWSDFFRWLQLTSAHLHYILLELFLMEAWHVLYFFTWSLQMWIQLSLTWASHDKHPV